MGRKKKKYRPQQFESLKGEGDTSANIYRSMLLSPAMKDLSSKQFELYVCAKSEYYGASAHDKDGFEDEYRNDPRYFTMNFGKFKKTGLYGMYTNKESFYKDIASLINHGFIDCEIDGYSTRSKSLFKFSDRWKLWGTDRFETPVSVMTTMMIRGL